MSPLQAINVLDQAAAAFVGTRADHYKFAEAVGVLLEAINPPKLQQKTETDDTSKG